MKKLALVALVVACHKEDTASHVTPAPSSTPVASASAATSAPSSTASASVAVSASASASVSAPVPARVACGKTTCAPNEFCLHYDSGSGGAYSPDKQHADATMCSREIPHDGSMNCGRANAARQVQCAAFIPRAPPHDPSEIQ